MIRYLHNASNEIEYTNKDGMVVTRNPFDPDFVFVSQRLSVINETASENDIARNNWEQAVRNAQISVDNGRPYPPLGAPPVRKVAPEDFTVPESTTDMWEPPLLMLKSAAPATAARVDIGPDSTARHPLAHLEIATAQTVADAMGVLASPEIEPALPAFMAMLQALFSHATKSKKPAAHPTQPTNPAA